MYLKILLYSLILVSITSYGQTINNKEITLFEQKLEKFYFNLYKELDNINDKERIYKKLLTNEDSVILAINDFYSKQKKEIIKYRLFLLEKFSNRSIPNLEKYKKNTENGITIMKIKVAEKNFFKTLVNETPILKLLFINPFEQVDLIKTVAMGQSIDGLIRYTAKNTIGKPLFSTEKINSSQWKIVSNSYNEIFICTYDYIKGEILNFEIFELKE